MALIGCCTCMWYVVDRSDPEPHHPENLDRELTPGCPIHDMDAGLDAAAEPEPLMTADEWWRDLRAQQDRKLLQRNPCRRR